MPISINCGVYTFGAFQDSPTSYIEETNSCASGALVLLTTADFDLINLDNFTTHNCFSEYGSYFNLSSNFKTPYSCTSSHAGISSSDFIQLETDYYKSFPPDPVDPVDPLDPVDGGGSFSVMPTPLEMTEAFGAGFFVVLPILLTILGGRMLLKSFFLSK